MPGRYGPYVKWDKVNATIPKDKSPETLTFEEALDLIAAKAPKSGKARASAKPARTPAAGKKPAATKKPAARKKPPARTKAGPGKTTD
jgi:DNA topoisomerase-1